MKKRWIVFFMVSLLLVTMLAGPALASEETSKSEITQLEEGGGEPTQPPKDPTNPPTAPTDPPKDPQPSECKHVWVEVTVPSTCTEQGGTCKVCSLCESIVITELAPLAAHTYDTACDVDCNVCGATREAAHKFSAGWDYNSTKHWHPCTICGAKGDEGAHYPGPAATEEKDQICLTCGKVMTQKRSHTHQAESTWSSDGTGHWHACKGCDEKLDFKAHSVNGTCGSPCTDCGYVSADGHDFGIAWKYSEADHWKVCSICGEEAQRETHDSENKVCTVCGHAPSTTETDHTHAFGDTWVSDEDSHWQVCDCGEESPKSRHAFKIGAPGEDGTVISVCNTCGFQKTDAAAVPQEESSFPVGIIFGILIVIIIGLVIALLAVLGVFKPRKKKSGHFTK